MSSKIIIILLLVIFFPWGFLSEIYKKFPFSIIRNIYWSLVSKDIPYDRDKKQILKPIKNFFKKDLSL